MADFKITRSDELMHYRTKGSKNGVRLYQNPDGSLTPLGERHYRDMYGYGERDGGVSKAIDAQLQRAARLRQTFRPTAAKTTQASGGQKPSVRGILKPPSTSREYNQEMLYNTLGNRLRNAGGKDRADTSSHPSKLSPEHLEELNNNSKKNEHPSKLSPEYLEELNYNSKKNEYPSGMQPVNTKQHEKSTRDGSALEKAYNDASKWVVDRADDVKKGATDAAVKVGDAAKNAYNDASKWVVDRADDARYAAEGAYNSAKNAVTDVVDRVKKTYGPGVADAARVISELPKNLSDPHLKEGFDNSYNAVKEWVTTAADDVKNTASEAFDAGKKWVDQAAKDVGKFADSALSDVTKAVDDAKKGVTDVANSVGKAAQDGWNWVKGLFGGGQQDDYGKDEDKDRSNHSSTSHKM